MKTAMVVDDSKIVRNVTKKILEALGYGNIAEAENGQLALEVFKAAKPSLVMLDWHMPVMDGLQFLKSLRALTGVEQPIVIFCTTETNLNNIQEAIIAGANEYVMKPFDEEIIRGKLEQLGLI